MTTKEFLSMVAVFIFQGVGTMVLSTKFELEFIDPTIFGYHELFHVLSLFSAFFVYQISYSAASRYKEIKHTEEDEDKLTVDVE
jgi:ABC-type enterochelin transport system permease subunit